MTNATQEDILSEFAGVEKDLQREPRVVSEGVSVTLWDGQTGEKHVFKKNIQGVRPQVVDGAMRRGYGLLGQVNEDGSYRWVTSDPKIVQRKGALKCRLHPDDAERALWDEMGLPVCTKANISSPYQVERHMKSRHPSAWQTIDQFRKDAKEAQDKADRDRQHEALMAALNREPVASKKAGA